jgi:ABC-type transporter Mla subunit MlaD
VRLAWLGLGARQGRVVGQVDVVGGLVAVLHHQAERIDRILDGLAALIATRSP